MTFYPWKTFKRRLFKEVQLRRPVKINIPIEPVESYPQKCYKGKICKENPVKGLLPCKTFPMIGPKETYIFFNFRGLIVPKNSFQISTSGRLQKICFQKSMFPKKKKNIIIHAQAVPEIRFLEIHIELRKNTRFQLRQSLKKIFKKSEILDFLIFCP